jgi:hypothetical protein
MLCLLAVMWQWFQRKWTCSAKAEFYVEMMIINPCLISLTDNQDSEFIHPCGRVWGACSCLIHSEDSSNVTGAFRTARTGMSMILDRVTVVPVRSVLFDDLHRWHGHGTVWQVGRRKFLNQTVMEKVIACIVKGRLLGLLRHCSLYRLIVPLAPMSSLIRLQRRHIPHRHERPQPAKEGTNTRYFASTFVIHGGTSFFYMPQSWDMGQILSLPLRRKAYWGFFRRLKEIQRLRPGSEPANSGARGQHANH